MPATYLLLRNNKQTGPFHLDELLQQGLQPHDLIWIEGQSAGWSHPSEIAALKPLIAGQKNVETPQQPYRSADVIKSAFEGTTQPLKNTSHIYVSLPASMRPAPEDATPAPDDLEAKAEALHQRIQAFAQGRAASEDADTHPARSLDNMKQEYGAWLAKQEKKKRHGVAKRKFIIAGAVLIVTTSVFGISKWMRKPALPKPSSGAYAVRPVVNNAPHHTTIAAFNTITDSVTLPGGEALPLKTDTAVTQTRPPNNTKQRAAGKKPALDKTPAPAPAADTTNAILPTPPPEEKMTPKEEVKKVVPLSRLVFVTGILPGENGNSGSATQVTLQNNSAETLKTVAVSVTYYKKGNRPLSKETVYFYNVAPASTPVITVSGNRRATAARFEIGAITRADGSLYLIH